MAQMVPSIKAKMSTFMYKPEELQKYASPERKRSTQLLSSLQSMEAKSGGPRFYCSPQTSDKNIKVEVTGDKLAAVKAKFETMRD